MNTVAPASVGLSRSGLERLTEVLHRWVDDREAAGAVALSPVTARSPTSRASAIATSRRARRLEHDAIFRIYSMSKPITAAAVMMLLEEGRFLLDDPIADFIPELAETGSSSAETSSGARAWPTSSDRSRSATS